jgi:hypothetical protein
MLSAAVLFGGCIGAPVDHDADYTDEADAVGVSSNELPRQGITPPAPRPAPPPPLRPPPVVVLPPGTPVIYIPSYSDLQLEGTMRFYGGGTPTLGLQIDVTNRGTVQAVGPSGHVSVSGVVLDAALYQYYGGSATVDQPNTLYPNEHGYIKVEVPAYLMAECQVYAVQIDLDHSMQAGDSSAFANDSGNVSTTCRLNWTTPIDTLHLGHAPDPIIAGKTLQDIVSSVVSGRDNGALCSDCHNSQSGGNFAYRPNVAPGVASAPIDPFQFIGGDDGWACGGNPWARQFVNLPASVYLKPEYLKDAFNKWLNDGGGR